jgi:hypothetical protein
MSTIPPSHHEGHRRASQVNMAATATTTATTTTKAKPVSKAGANGTPKQKTQMHRRSRTGSSLQAQLMAGCGS